MGRTLRKFVKGAAQAGLLGLEQRKEQQREEEKRQHQLVLEEKKAAIQAVRDARLKEYEKEKSKYEYDLNEPERARQAQHDSEIRAQNERRTVASESSAQASIAASNANRSESEEKLKISQRSRKLKEDFDAAVDNGAPPEQLALIVQKMNAGTASSQHNRYELEALKDEYGNEVPVIFDKVTGSILGDNSSKAPQSSGDVIRDALEQRRNGGKAPPKPVENQQSQQEVRESKPRQEAKVPEEPKKQENQPPTKQDDRRPLPQFDENAIKRGILSMYDNVGQTVNSAAHGVRLATARQAVANTAYLGNLSLDQLMIARGRMGSEAQNERIERELKKRGAA